jgi:hypothetical protein
MKTLAETLYPYYLKKDNTADSVKLIDDACLFAVGCSMYWITISCLFSYLLYHIYPQTPSTQGMIWRIVWAATFLFVLCLSFRRKYKQRYPYYEQKHEKDSRSKAQRLESFLMDPTLTLDINEQENRITLSRITGKAQARIQFGSSSSSPNTTGRMMLSIEEAEAIQQLLKAHTSYDTARWENLKETAEISETTQDVQLG